MRDALIMNELMTMTLLLILNTMVSSYYYKCQA
jgi:hypothetical protein